MGRSKEKTQEKRNNELLSNGSFKFCNVWISQTQSRNPRSSMNPTMWVITVALGSAGAEKPVAKSHHGG